MKKWFSRKLLVAVLAVVAIAVGNVKGEAAEGAVMNVGNIVVDAVIALVGAVYVIVQGGVDKAEQKNAAVKDISKSLGMKG